MAALKLKQGETFSKPCRYLEDDKTTPVNLTGAVIKSQVRSKDGSLVETLTITVTNAANGEFTMSSASTDGWPAGALVLDVKFTFSTSKMLTETIGLEVIKAVTVG